MMCAIALQTQFGNQAVVRMSQAGVRVRESLYIRRPANSRTPEMTPDLPANRETSGGVNGPGVTMRSSKFSHARISGDAGPGWLHRLRVKDPTKDGSRADAGASAARGVVGILVHGDNHFIVRGPLPDRDTALALVRHWSLIGIGATAPPWLAAWRIVSREFRENLQWAVFVPGDAGMNPAVKTLLAELSQRGVLIHDSRLGPW